MLCVLILYKSGGTYSLKSTPNNRFFVKHFMVILVFARHLLRENRRRNTFCILFWCLALGSNPGFTSNKPTHYSLDYGDLLSYYYCHEKVPSYCDHTIYYTVLNLCVCLGYPYKVPYKSIGLINFRKLLSIN